MPISRDGLPIPLVGFAHCLVRFANFLSKICFGNRFRVTEMTKALLTENNGQHPRRCFSSRFSETVITSAVLTENDAKRILDQKRRVTVLVRRAHFTE